jgi:5-methylcytosine-specific restriction endonuclease McrA
MVKKRDLGFKIILEPEAAERIKNGQCPSCGKPKKEWTRRKDWTCCSSECTHEYITNRKTVNWAELRDKVLKRDNYTCIACGEQPTSVIDNVPENKKDEGYWYFGGPVLRTEKQEDGNYKVITANTSKLVADHIKAIALGGEQWDSENIQTLCEKCNKRKTRLDAARIASLRKKEKILSGGQKQLITGGIRI